MHGREDEQGQHHGDRDESKFAPLSLAFAPLLPCPCCFA